MTCKKCGEDISFCMEYAIMNNGCNTDLKIPDIYKGHRYIPICEKCRNVIDYMDLTFDSFMWWIKDAFEYGTPRNLVGKALMRYFCLDEVISEELFGNTQEIKNDLGEGIINCNISNDRSDSMGGSMGEIYILDKTKADHLLSLGFKYVTRQMDGKEVYVFIQTKELMNEIATKFDSVSFAVSKTVKF